MNILIITKKCGEEEGVGGRRWRLLSQELYKYYNISIVTSNRAPQLPSNFGPRIIHLPSRNNRAWSLIPRKLKRAYEILFKDYIDSDEKWIRSNFGKLKSIILEDKIDIVIASGHPCSINLYAAILKVEQPNIKLVQDFRDLWNSEENYSLRFFKNCWNIRYRSIWAENFATSQADLILNVSDGQRKSMQRINSANHSKYMTLFNGFKEKEMGVANNKKINGFHFVHIGAIRWQGCMGFLSFLNAIKLLEHELSEIDFRVDFYGTRVEIDIPDELKNISDKYFRFHQAVSQSEVSGIVSRSYIGLLIFDKETGLATKTFEYIANQRPVFSISPEGEVKDFCNKHGFYGCSFQTNMIIDNLKLAIKDFNQGREFCFESLEEFHVENIATKLIIAIENL